VSASSDLRWHEHVNSVSSRDSKTLNFIRCNVYCCPLNTKATAYISLVRPHLEYAAAAWDPYLVVDCEQLEKVQRRAARFVEVFCCVANILRANTGGHKQLTASQLWET